MKVAMVHWYYLPHPGGVEHLMKTISEELVNCGIEVNIVAGKSPLKYQEKNPKIQVDRTEYFSMDKKEEVEEGEIVEFLVKYIRENNIDIIHAHNFQLPYSPKHTSAIHSAGIITDTPVVLHVHNPINSRRERILLESFGWDAVIPVSKFVARGIYDKTEVKADRIKFIPNVVNTEVFSPVKSRKEGNKLRKKLGLGEEKIILCPTRILTTDGKLVDNKGVKTFIHALSHLSESENSFKGIITGPENEYYPEESREAKECLKGLARALDVESSFMIPDDTIPDEEMPVLYSISDIVALPSIGEAFGLVYTEGMATEKPVVGCLAGAVPEIIENEKTGFLIKPNSPSSLFEAFKKLLESSKTRKEMGKEGRKMVLERYSASSVARRYRDLYRPLISRKGKKVRSAH